MLETRKLRRLLFLSVLLVLIIAIGSFLYFETQRCMDVPVISEDKLLEYTDVSTLDISQLTFNGQPVAADLTHNTIYISQSPDKISHYTTLQGTLQSRNSNYTLFFVASAVLDNLPAAVQNGTPLSLVIIDGDVFQTVNVVITTLPVLNMNGAVTGKTEEDRDVLSGFATLWVGLDPYTETYSTTSSSLQWHIRGASSSENPKKPFKLSLKDLDGNNANYNLLGLGADDDWILNPMNMEDTKIREKFAMDFWNQYLSQDEVQNRMSSGEYVELVINNAYQGLYLLQRRIDPKYLQINRSNDILLKGANTWTPASLAAGYEIIYSPYSEEDTYWILDDVLSALDHNEIDVTKYIETEVFLNYLSAPDNTGYKNMFYLLKWEGNRFKMQLIPWDTDMAMGVIWTDTFAYNYTASLNLHIERQEHNDMIQQYPRLDEMIASYWQESREQVYTEENILQLLTENISVICSSGAYLRDAQKWGVRYGGSDTHDALLTWCTERLAVLDSQYAD